MSRQLLGFLTVNPFEKKKTPAKEAFMRNLKGETEPLSNEEVYRQAFEKKLGDMHKQSGCGKFANLMPGVDPNSGRVMSKSTEHLLQSMAAKKAKKEALEKKKKREALQVHAKYYTGMQGGRIDGRGNIYGPDGRWIASVDKKGVVRSRNGLKICKYNSKSSFCEHQISAFIQREYNRRKGTIYAVNATGTVNEGVWGKAGDVGMSAGSVWGDGPGGWWGND